MALPRGPAAAELPTTPLSDERTGLLAKEVRSLVQRLRLFTPPRWAAVALPWGTRADLVRHLSQALADLASDLEGSQRRNLPVLAPDLLLADQLAVTGDDLARILREPAAEQAAVAHLLLHRWDLLGELPPQTLGGASVLPVGRALCGRDA